MKNTINADQHEEMVKSLLEDKSLSALIFLLDAGRELEVKMSGNTYFVSRDKSKKYVSIWRNQEEQSFDNAYDLIEKAIVGDKPFYFVWKEAEILTLF